MTSSRIQRILLGAYPSRFRTRYGAELAALLQDCGAGWPVTVDLARGALLAWVRPSFSGHASQQRRGRLQATTSTVFVLWSFAALAAAVFARAVDDQPVPGLKAWGWTAYVVGAGVFQVTTGAVLIAGFAYWCNVVVRAARSRDRSVLVPAVVPVAVVGVWLAATALVAVLGHHLAPGNDRHITSQGPHTVGGWAVLAVYAVFTVACVAACAAGAVTALYRSAIPVRLLAVSTAISAVVAASLVVVAASATICLVRVVGVGGMDARNTAMAVGPVVIFVLASVAALTSVRRGIPAVRAAGR